ncbi:MAG: amidohydrolase family protein, partial [Pseudomonadota bacterium]
MIVDMRLRPPLKTWITKPQYGNVKTEKPYRPTQLGYPRPPSAEARSFDLLFKEMDEAGIKWGVIMGRQSVEPNGIIPNDEIFECVSKYPDRFVGWMGLDLSRGPDWWIEEIRRCMKFPGCKGVSIEPTQAVNVATRRADDRRLYPIYEECLRLDMPISIGLSGLFIAKPYLRFEDATPAQLFQVARDFPKLQIVCSHAGWPFVIDMIGVAFDCPNIWISPDLYAVPL